MTYSGGMRRRLDLAMTLVGDPRIIFLDEPTTGLDPRSRRVMWDIVRELVAAGVTILLTTQYLEEADRLASRIALLDGGRIVAQGTPAELKRLVPGGSVRLEFGDEAALDRAAAALGDGTRDDQGLALELPSDGGVRSLRALLDRLDAERHRGRRACRSAPPTSTTSSSPSPAARDGQPDERVPTPMTAYVITDSSTMLRRSLRRMRRYPSLTFFVAGIPVVFLLLFVYVFGGTLGAGLGGAVPGGLPLGAAGDGSIGRDAYLAYVLPGILLDHRRRGRDRDRDLGGDGHDRGDHRPLPDDGDRAGLGARRARPRAASSRRCSRPASWSWSPWSIGFRPTTGPARVGRGRRPARADGGRRRLAVRRARAW